ARGERAKLLALGLLDPKKQVLAVEKEVEAAKQDVELAKLAVEECRVEAPVAGMVVRVLGAEGESLGPTARQPALDLRPDGRALMVRAEVEQEFADLVSAGMAVDIFDDTRSREPRWTGKLRTVSNWFTHRRSMVMEPLQFNDVRTLECIIDVDPLKE